MKLPPLLPAFITLLCRAAAPGHAANTRHAGISGNRCFMRMPESATQILVVALNTPIRTRSFVIMDGQYGVGRVRLQEQVGLPAWRPSRRFS